LFSYQYIFRLPLNYDKQLASGRISIIKNTAEQSQLFYKRMYLCVYTAVNNHRGYILHKARKKKGRRQDYDFYKKNHPVTPSKQVVNVFLGYLGVEKDFPEQLSALPYRRKRNQQCLSQEEKEYNKIHSKKRIVIEHTICRLKKYRIMSDIFRNKLRKYNRISDIIAGLINYRIIN
jgi:DDE superfamily endonuclease